MLDVVRNPEWKSIVVKVIAIQLMLAVIMYLFLNHQVGQIHHAKDKILGFLPCSTITYVQNMSFVIMYEENRITARFYRSILFTAFLISSSVKCV